MYADLVPSRREKYKNNFELAREIITTIAGKWSTNTRRFKELTENYELHNGEWKSINRYGKTHPNITIGDENIAIDQGEIRHYPIINNVTKLITADIISSPLIATVVDKGENYNNSYRQMKIEKVREFYRTNVVEPLKKQIAIELLSQVDPTQLTEELLQKIQMEVDRRVVQMLPDNVVKALRTFQSPDQKIFQKFLDFVIEDTDAKNKFNLGGENAIWSAEEYYRINIINGRVVLDVLDPRFVMWGGSQGTEFVEDASWACYVRYLSLEDVISRYGKVLKKKDLQNIARYINAIYSKKGEYKRYWEDDIERKAVDYIADTMQFPSINIKSREGQEQLKYVYSMIDGGYTGGRIREIYVTWKMPRLMKLVERIDPRTGDIKEFFFAEHYETNPLYGDVRVRNIVVNQAWHGVLLGHTSGDDGVFVNIEPLPYQYGSLDNPFDTKLSIYGGRDYPKFTDTDTNPSFVSLAKPWQYRYDLLMKKIIDYEVTDIGKVMLMNLKMIPSEMSPSDWFKALYRLKTVLYDADFEGSEYMKDKNVVGQVDLSNVADQMAQIQKLEYFEKKIYASMYSNPAKLGNISPYATNRNMELSHYSSDLQMMRFFERRRIIKERVLKALLNYALIAYKDNERIKGNILDDTSRMYFDLNYDKLSPENIALYVSDSVTHKQNLMRMKELAINMVQGIVSPYVIYRIINANSMVEIEEVLLQAEAKLDEQRKAEMENALQQLQIKQQAELEKIQLQEGLKTERQKLIEENKLKTVEITSSFMERAADVDRDKINDSFEKELLRQETKRQQLEIEKMLREKELQIKEKELELRKQMLKKVEENVSKGIKK